MQSLTSCPYRSLHGTSIVAAHGLDLYRWSDTKIKTLVRYGVRVTLTALLQVLSLRIKRTAAAAEQGHINLGQHLTRV